MSLPVLSARDAAERNVLSRMENFISGSCTEAVNCETRRLTCNDAGYPGCEFQIREALAEVLGRQKSEYFFDKVSGARIP